jgi:nucleotide-binding universal stress UspA family protein
MEDLRQINLNWKSEVEFMEVVNKEKEESEKKLQKTVDKLQKQGIAAHYDITMDLLMQEVDEYAEKNNIDLIVSYTHGHEGVRGTRLFATHTQLLARNAPCPVLSFRTKPQSVEINKIVYVSDFYEDDVNIKGLQDIKAFASLFNAKVHLLYVNTPQFFESTSFSKQKINDILEKVPIQNAEIHIYNSETIVKGVNEFASEINADLVSIATHGHRGFFQLFKYSVAEDLINNCNYPVLTFNERK